MTGSIGTAESNQKLKTARNAMLVLCLLGATAVLLLIIHRDTWACGNGRCPDTGSVIPRTQTTQPEAMEAYRLKLRLSTTSGWTRVIFENATMAVTAQEIVEGAAAPDLFIVGQPEIDLGRSDETQVVVEFELYVSGFVTESLELAVGKGHNGTTVLEFFNLNQAVPQPIATLTHTGVADPDDPLNRRFFAVPRQGVAAGGPLFLPRPAVPQEVLAFYYPWYGLADGPSGEMRVWDQYPPVRTPLSGFYDSHDPAAVVRQIRDARAAGIDGFIVSWWGIDDFTDRALRQAVLPAAEQEGFTVTIYYENFGRSQEQIVQDFAYLIQEYGPSPAFLKVDGRPVLFIYRTVFVVDQSIWEYVFQNLDAQGLACFCVADGIDATYHPGDDQFRYIFDLFQGVHLYAPLGYLSDVYSPDYLSRLYASNALEAAVNGLLFAATVSPGFDNSSWAPAYGQDELIIDRKAGQLYRRTWDAALASNPHWILITSFNEWPEGTEIEPSQELGQQYAQLNKEFVTIWKDLHQTYLPLLLCH